MARLTWTPAKAKAEDPLPRWRIEGSPAVIIMASALFSGASTGKDAISFPAVPALFENLLMLMHRFPIAIAPSARVPFEEAFSDVVDAWRMRNGYFDTWHEEAPTGFKGELKPFQNEGLRFLIAGRRALLADDMGLGKTPMALAFLAKTGLWPAVILCQPHVVAHWRRKIEEFLEIEEVKKATDARQGLKWCELRGQPSDYTTPHADLFLLHYLSAAKWEPWLAKRGIKAVVFDEAQELRHTSTQKYDACKDIARPAVAIAGLSGTPIYNRGPEIYNVMNTLNRGCLGTFVDFKDRWCTIDDTGKWVVKDPVGLGQYLRDRNLMLRRTKDEVMSELPEKRRVIEPIDSDNTLFASLIHEAAKLAREALHERKPLDRARMEAEAISQTRRATGIAKAPAVLAFVRGLMEAEEPTLLFAHHHDVYDVLLNGLDEFRPVAITGREDMRVKDRHQKQFQAGETNLCLISLRAATGLDGLQERARVVTFGELDWSPAIHRQAEDRAHRMGQRESVLCYYLVADIGTDPHMMATLDIKASQFMGLMHDPALTEEKVKEAQRVAEDHKAKVLEALRSHR